MTKQTQEQRWQTAKKQGRAFFVFKYGILGWGFSTGILGSIILQLVSSGFNLSILFTKSFYYYMTTFTMMTVFFGFFWGLALWSIMKKQAENQEKKSHD